jgi:alkanesulfonate monooxygenase SsuD/methylene tetrahydromethanopterin reductase-like flavin-dependent oxidoreductase (luciferase family)
LNICSRINNVRSAKREEDTMEFGIALASNLDGWKTAKRAEELGFSHAWFYDTQMLSPDIFVTMALAATQTSKIKLGAGVLVPSNRIAPVAANGFASLNQLAPGRLILGLGTGFTARNTMGLPPVRLADLREYVRIVRGLLRGEIVEIDFPEGRRKVRFLNPDGLINIRDAIPIHFSAFAPKMRKLTAEVGDGWMTFMFDLERAVDEAKRVDEACREVGREPRTLYKTVFTLGCVLGDKESADGTRAKAQAGPLAVVFLHGLVEATLGPPLSPRLEALLEEYRKLHQTYEPPDARYLQMHTQHLLGVRPEEQRFLTAELIGATTFTARSEELRERLRALKVAGYQQFVIQLVRGQEAAIEDWARLAEGV